MNLNDFLDTEQEITNELVKAEEGQLIIAQQIQNQLIAFEKQRKEIEKKEKEMKAKLYEVMKENGITGYESNDKKIKISLSDDGVTETIDKERLFLEKPDVFREYVKETPRKGSIRITIRGDK